VPELSLSATVAAPLPAAPAPPAARVRRHTGERLAVGATAAAVAMLPLLRPGGPGNVAPVDVLIAVALLAWLVWAGLSGLRCRFPYGLAVSVFVAGGAIGALAGPVPGAGILAVIQDLVLLAWCWAVVNVASSPGRLRILMATWAYSAIGWVVVLFVGIFAHATWITGQTSREGSRTALTLIDPNYAASYFVMSIMIIWATGYPRRRSVRMLGYALLVAAILSTGSNSGVVSLLVGSLTAGVVLLYRRGGMVAAVAASAAVLVGGAALSQVIDLKGIQQAAHGSGIAFLRDGIGRGDKSVGQRQMLVGESLRLYEAGGPLGQGPVSTKVRLKRDLAPFVKEAHDDYLAALIERGAVGFVGLLLLYVSIGRRMPALARGRLSAGYAAVVVRPHALVGATVGAIVAGAVYELLHVRHLWTLFAFVAALHLWGRE
jgi:hypothetical protein